MKHLWTFILFASMQPFVYAQPQGCSRYVNPFIGATTNTEKPGAYAGLGKTFPGATTPFGLVQVSPNTITGGDNGSGYSYEHTTIEGFAFTQMSGVGWYGDLGNFLVTPTLGPLRTSAAGYRSAYVKSTEKATAGYYAATLTDYHIRAEMTAAPHSGILRFTFPENKQSRIQIDLARRVGGTSVLQYVKVVDDHSIQGWMKCTADGGGWGDGGGQPDYTVYFFAEFSKPLKNFGVWSAHIPDAADRHREAVESKTYQQWVAASEVLKQAGEKQGKHLGFYLEFPTKPGEQVLMKAGISLVSMDGAKANLQQEISGWDFDLVHRKAVALWDTALSKITVQGGTTDERTIFYTALYHTMIDPRITSDVDGTYMGADGRPHLSGSYRRRSIFSGWDVFRSQFPLQTIIDPGMVNDMINSLVSLAAENGTRYLERWEFLNAYSGCMVGNPAVAVLADAYAKGIRGYNVDTAYAFAVNTCRRFGNGIKGYTPGSISETLEYAYSSWCMSRLAVALHKPEDAARYAAAAQDYKNIFDTAVGWFRPKKANGLWAPWPAKGRLAQDYGCVESNPYQQGWFVPQDIDGMVRLMGGREKVTSDLESFFEKTPGNFLWNDYYNHANEPVHHVPFLFNRLGAPWLTQQWTRKICAGAYHNSVDGLVGNDDVGQMSAWYVLAAIGMHPICPGDTRFELTSPVFSDIHILVGPGRNFHLIAHNNSKENSYIQSATLNGQPWHRCYLDYSDIIKGGTLELVMGNVPNKKWGVPATQQEKAFDPLPSPRQLAWEDKEFYLFTHFGPNTFTDLEWGKGSEKEEVFNPTAFDPRQWCRIAKAAGAKGIIITAKHHDGFCLWPSRYSSHTVAQSGWRNGKGDVLKELSDACREYGLEFGIYLSPWDRNHPKYGTAEYNEVFINMMKEVVSRYGPLFEFWWDGANGEGPNGKRQVYAWHRFEATMRAIAPNTPIFSDIGPDIRWVGNEKGIAARTNWDLLDTAGFSRGAGAPPVDTLNSGNCNGAIWLPAECDVSIRPGWFYHQAEDTAVKSPEQLFDLWLKSVGRGANLLLNVPPDRRGLFTDYDSAALMGFKRLRDQCFGISLLRQPGVTITLGRQGGETAALTDQDAQTYVSLGKDYRDNYIDVGFPNATDVDCIVLQEPIRLGQRIKDFSAEIVDGNGDTVSIRATTIGHKRILTFPARRAASLRIRITDAKAIPLIGELEVFMIPETLIEKN